MTAIIQMRDRPVKFGNSCDPISIHRLLGLRSVRWHLIRINYCRTATFLTPSLGLPLLIFQSSLLALLPILTL